jgi:hypothetical protein
MNKSIIFALALALNLGFAAHAATDPCTAKIKAFSKSIGLNYIDLAATKVYVDHVAGSNKYNVLMISAYTSQRSLVVKVDSQCGITGVDSPDMDLGSNY